MINVNNPKKVQEIKDVLTKLNETVINASMVVRQSGHHKMADELCLQVGYVTGVVYGILPENSTKEKQP